MLEVAARERIKRAERLVHKGDRGLGRKCARDGDALLHAAGELTQALAGEIDEPDNFQIPHGDLATRPGRHALALQAELYASGRPTVWTARGTGASLCSDRCVRASL